MGGKGVGRNGRVLSESGVLDGTKGGFLYTRFNPREQKGLICTREEQCEGRRGQKGRIRTRESIVVCERGDFAHVDCRARIIVEFYVVITDTIAGFAASHRPYVTSADRQPRRTWPAHGHGGFCKSLTIRYHFKRSVETQTFFGHVSTPHFITH